MAEGKQQQSTYKGWLYKWTNYLKGYQKRWFVLQNGLLSYYRYEDRVWVGGVPRPWPINYHKIK